MRLLWMPPKRRAVTAALSATTRSAMVSPHLPPYRRRPVARAACGSCAGMFGPELAGAASGPMVGTYSDRSRVRGQHLKACREAEWTGLLRDAWICLTPRRGDGGRAHAGIRAGLRFRRNVLLPANIRASRLKARFIYTGSEPAPVLLRRGSHGAKCSEAVAHRSQRHDASPNGGCWLRKAEG